MVDGWAAREMIVCTSVEVNALEPTGAVPAMKGKKRGLTAPLIPPTGCGTNSDAGAMPPGNEMTAPAMLATFVGAGGLATFEKGRRMPSTRILSPVIPLGAWKPRVPDAAINSSNG